MTKKRRCTYAIRREKANGLLEEIRKLESSLEVLQTRSGATVERSIMREALSTQTLLLSIARLREMEVAKAQSAVSRCLGTFSSYPLYSRICLGTDWDQRRATLLSIREKKLQNTYDYITIRRQLQKLSTSLCSNEVFETDNGELCSVRFETIMFPEVESLEQVFNAVMFYFNNTETIISDCLGDRAVRDDYDCVGGGVVNSRVIATNNDGITVEVSTLIMSKLFTEENDEFNGGEECGVVAIESVDEDALYPYDSSKRVRLDLTCGLLLTASKTKTADGGGLVVALHRSAFMKLHQPNFPISAVAEQTMRHGYATSGDFMVQAIRRIVYGSFKGC